MGYEPLYHVRTWRGAKLEVFLYIETFPLLLQNKVEKIY